jgi:hypothetical protein
VRKPARDVEIRKAGADGGRGKLAAGSRRMIARNLELWKIGSRGSELRENFEGEVFLIFLEDTGGG